MRSSSESEESFKVPEALVWSGQVAIRLSQASPIIQGSSSMLRGGEQIPPGWVERLKVEAENSWQIEKEKFLQSKEFNILCSGRASVFFKKGFDGCLAQFRANGYPEEEHPALFLDVEQALADMPEDEDSEEGSSGGEEAPPS
ncbi:hypothetical protein F511_13121 [Dorcoceras hygrometricum]|uniref:Uncharacterized protein n=1 Tax=Dorcoceras hygrometricum TaxID=472368 RepID=A0A2Z7D4J8_9LAMI|nr:hypothetical protein F511_13121 [Dorcoceras hygrometricum]